MFHSRSPHMGSTARNRQKKAAEIVNCYLIPVAVVPRSIKTLLGGSDSLLWSRGSVFLVFAVINLSGFFFVCLLWFFVFLWVCTRLVALPPECSCSENLRLFPLKSFEDQQAFPPGATALLEEPVAAESSGLSARLWSFLTSPPHVDYAVCRLSKLHDDLHGFPMSFYKAGPVYFVKSFWNAC